MQGNITVNFICYLKIKEGRPGEKGEEEEEREGKRPNISTNNNSPLGEQLPCLTQCYEHGMSQPKCWHIVSAQEVPIK